MHWQLNGMLGVLILIPFPTYHPLVEPLRPSRPSMQLCLANNDPISTLLVTPDGEPVFSIETPPLLPLEAPSPSRNPTEDGGLLVDPFSSLSPQRQRQRSPTTTITRIESHRRSVGRVETLIGVVEYRGPEGGTDLRLCAQNHALAIAGRGRAPVLPSTASASGEEEEERRVAGSSSDGDVSGDDFRDQDQTCWEFIGPDDRRYKWLLFVHSPVLLTADNTLTPLARYRRAKLGIVSRSRRAFLEILPAGTHLVDLIVVTFVGFMKQRVLVEGAVYETFDSSPSSSTPTVLPSHSALHSFPIAESTNDHPS